MFLDLDRALVEVSCPSCGYGIEIQVLDARTQVWRRCSCCRVQTRLIEPDGSLSVEVDSAHKAMRDLENMIEGMIK